MSRRARRGRRLALLLVATGAGVALLTGAVLNDTLTYYRTPSEISHEPVGEHVRLAGAVVAGSLRPDGDGVRFQVTDGRKIIAVRAPKSLPRMFDEGREAVLEGSLGADGTFTAERVLAKHGTTYRAATTEHRPP